MDAIRRFGAEGLPVLGVCLGHQAIGQVYGGVVRRAGSPVHGKTDEMSHDGRGVFAGLPDPFTATRYHSLVVDEHLPSCLELSAWNEDGIVMGVRHRELPVHGVQFHPESVLTAVGLDLLRNFLVMGRDEVEQRPAATRDACPARRTRRSARRPARTTEAAVPNDVLSAALQELSRGHDLTEEQARDVLLEIMGGRAGEAQTAAFLSALRVKGETAEEIVGMARAMTRARREGRGGRRRHPRHLRHRRRRRPHLQHLDGGRPGGRRRRRHRGQARQPLGHQQVRQRRRARGPGRGHRHRPRPGEPLHRARPASASCSRPATTWP